MQIHAGSERVQHSSLCSIWTLPTLAVTFLNNGDAAAAVFAIFF